MGGLLNRRKNQYDPNFYNDPYYPGGLPPTGVPGPYSYPPGPDPYGGLGGYEPDPYGYGYYETDPFLTYGSPYGRRTNYYGGRYGRGLSQMGGLSPLNYGNFYMGNTTMQMLPMMQRKLAKYALRQGMGGLGGLGGFGGGCCMPMMPMMPMMPVAAPMMAVAAPLPVAYNPLIQGMYPMVTANAANWMTPASFMSALASGPMPYRPPASFELPNNIGMVMTVPYGAPNPLLSPSTFGGFSPQFNAGSGYSCCCTYCTPCAPPPTITYYPRPVCVPQPCPVPCPVPVPIPNVQQVPVPKPYTVVAPPIVANCNQPLSIPAGAPLLPSQGGFTQNGFGQTLVMASHNSTSETLLSDETPSKSKHDKSTLKTNNEIRRRKAQELAASLSNLGINTSISKETTSSRRKNQRKSRHTSLNFDTLSKGKNSLDSDWLTSDELSDILNKSKYDRYTKSSTHRHKNSSRSHHNCVACRQEQLNKND